jgi:Flp pilus assembly protein CpaB
MLATRRGTLGVALFAALLALGLLLFFMEQYRSSVDESGRPVTVLVARGVIEQGTSGDVIAGERLFRQVKVTEARLRGGAFTDPSSLRGQVTGQDIYPGQQLTRSAFKTTAPGDIGAKLSGLQRAIAIPVDGTHGLIGDIGAGDRIDVLAGFQGQSRGQGRPIVVTLLQDVLVLKVRAGTGGLGGGGRGQTNVVVRVTDQEANGIAYASENGKLWLTLRPAGRAQESPPSLAALEALLAGLRPIKLDRGGR